MLFAGEVITMSWLYLTEAGAKLGMREGRYVISRENETMAEVPSEMVEGVTLIDRKLKKPLISFN